MHIRTRVTWLKDGKERATTFLGPTDEEFGQEKRGGHDYRPEYWASSHLASA